MKLASIQKIVNVEKHPNADLLDIAQVLNYKCIVKKDQWKIGDLCVFIEPDSVLPDKEWAAFYKAKSSRVKAIKLRGSWSFGIIENLKIIFGDINNEYLYEEGKDITEILGVQKYEPPQPQDLQAAGPYMLGIPRTDEEKWQSLEAIPYGEVCDVTLKIDGQSWSGFYKIDKTKQEEDEEYSQRGIGGRSFIYKFTSDNNYTRNEKHYDVIKKLIKFCLDHNVNLCVRGEQYGQGIQKSGINPHNKAPLNLAFYSTWLIDERRYARKGEPYYIHTIAPELNLPTVPIIEKDVILTPELIKKYDEDLEFLYCDSAFKHFGGEECMLRSDIKFNKIPFEGVVIQWEGGSFKIINKYYDSKK